eukprot:883821-Pleurochrysis_carterae.AAC.1
MRGRNATVLRQFKPARKGLTAMPMLRTHMQAQLDGLASRQRTAGKHHAPAQLADNSFLYFALS